MAKLIIKATPEQQAWIAEHAGKRWAAVTRKWSNEVTVLVSLRTSYKSACEESRTYQTVTGGTTVIEAAIKGVDFFDTYDFWVEPPIVEACEVELQPERQPEGVISKDGYGLKQVEKLTVAELQACLGSVNFLNSVVRCHIDAESVNLPIASELVNIDPYLAVGVVFETKNGITYTAGYRKNSPLEIDNWVQDNVLPHIEQYELLDYREFKSVTTSLVTAGLPMWAHCGYILEGGLISACLADDSQRFRRPYYLHDLATVLAILGEEKPESDDAYIEKHGLTEWLPVGHPHDPVYDCLVSALVLDHALSRLTVK